MAEAEPNRPSALVGIGASAGGLAALRQLLSLLPNDTGLAFVVVVHLSPDQRSLLADLLQTHCSMPVHQVTGTEELVPNQVFVIPPGHNLSTVDSHLRLSEPGETSRVHHPIDHFFRAMADTHDGHAIGVVLSGTGSDGTAGLELIKQMGGVAIAQAPDEAEYDGMPRSAVASGVVDVVAPISIIADHLIRIARAETQLPPIDVSSVAPDTRQLLSQILAEVRTRSGHDATGYKESTAWRRIRRRMQILQVDDVEDYLERLRLDPDEVDRLFDDLLISVTSFFRDPAVFERLEADIVPRLFDGKGPHDSVRVWSVGCASGEEAYSLGMLLLEYAQAMKLPPQVQLFATDLHRPSLERARRGVYPATIEDQVSSERLRRFFVRRNEQYRVRDELREVVVFAAHGVLKDPPFSHIDLISCRNLLIYLERNLQRNVISLFHYALNPGGHLMLGSSETLDRSDLFATIDKNHCFFRRREASTRQPPLPAFAPIAIRHLNRTVTAPERDRTADGYDAIHARLVQRSTPPSVLIDAEHRIVHVAGDAGRYLTQPSGEPTHDLFRLVPDALRLELRSVVHAARTDNRPTTGRPVVMPVDGEDRQVIVEVVPADDGDATGFTLVVFTASAPAAEPSPDEGSGQEVHQLQADLDINRQRLEAIIERYEASQEAMQAANEELQSSNEELRSTMEELETSKEELQSMNEELSTLYQENRHKVDELSLLSGDLQNLLAATDVATLFLNRRLRIVRFTPPVTSIFNIVDGDRGRPLTDFSHRLLTDDLPTEATQVLERLTPIEHEIGSLDGRWFLTRILPYRSIDDHIEGVVITFVDITHRLEIEASLRASERRLRLALDASVMGTWSWEPDSGESEADARCYEIIGSTPDNGPFMAELERSVIDPSQGMIRSQLANRFRRPTELTVQRLDNGEVVSVELHAQPDDLAIGTARVIGTIQDVTTRTQATRMLARRSERLALLSDAAANLLRGSDPEHLLGLLLDRVSTMLDLEIYERYDLDSRRQPRLIDSAGLTGGGYDTAPGIGAGVCAQAFASHSAIVRNDLTNPKGGDEVGASLRRAGITAYACFPLLIGSHLLGALAFGTRGDRRLDGETVEFIRTVVDHLAVASQRLQAEVELRELNESLESAVADRTRDLAERERQLQALVDASFQAVWTADNDGRIRHSSPSWPIDDSWTQRWPATGWIDAVHPAHGSRSVIAWRRAVAQRTTMTLDVQIGDQGTDRWRWVTVRAVPIEGDDGEPRGWAGTILDIDERTRADRQIRSLAADLVQAEASERQRIAAVLHDDLQQLLYSAQMRLGLLREQVDTDTDTDTGHRHLIEIDRFLEDSLSLARRLTADLSPLTLDEPDLAVSIGQLADEMREMHGLDVEVAIDAPLLVPEPDSRIVILQAVRELLFNVVKHADRQHATVEGSADDGTLVLVIGDHGPGLDAAAVIADIARPGRGLANLIDQLNLIGATLDFDTRPGSATLAAIRLPLPPT